MCTRDEVPELIGLLSSTFAAHDPPAVAVGLTPDDLQAYLAPYGAIAGGNNMTTLARDFKSGELAGALLTLDAAADPGLADRLSAKFEPIMGIFSLLESRTESSQPEPGETLSLLMLGVADNHVRRGIAQELVRQSLGTGAAHGYGHAVTVATNPVSQHIFRKLGFVTLATTSYADYRQDGVAVFSSIVDQGGPMLMARDGMSLASTGFSP